MSVLPTTWTVSPSFCAWTSNVTGLVTPRSVSSPVAVAVIGAPSAGIAPSSIGAVSTNVAVGNVVGVHQPAVELVVPAVLVADDGRHVDLERGLRDLRAGDRELAGDLVGAADALGVLAEEHLDDAVADGAAGADRPRAVGVAGCRRRGRRRGRRAAASAVAAGPAVVDGAAVRVPTWRRRPSWPRRRRARSDPAGRP